MAAVNTPTLENQLGDLAASATTCLEKMWCDGRIIESVSLVKIAYTEGSKNPYPVLYIISQSTVG